MAIIAIISVGVYNAYLLLIRQTKDGEVKQTVALEGKKIIEDIKGNTEGKSFDVTDKSNLDLGDISLDKKGLSGENYFEQEIHLNKDLEKTTDTNYLYTQTIKIQKAKSVKSDKTESNIDLDNKIVSASGIAENTNRISYNLKLIKASNIGAKVYIQDDNHGPLEVSKNSEGKVVLNIYIQTENGSKTKNVSVKDFDGILPLTEVKKLPLSNDGKADQLYLSINFDEYKKQESGTLNTEINVFNYDQETATNITNINIEKPRELDVDVKARKGEVNIYSNRTKSTDVVKFGILYDIQVNINDKDGQNLFSGFSNQNINIK